MQHFTISALGELLLESIPIHFPDRGLILRRDSLAIVTIPSIHPEIGNVEIHDEINFLSVQLLDFTYVEICNYDKKISLRKRHQKIVDETIGMLIDLFGDRIEFYKSYWGGGIRPKGSGFGKAFLWSGPADRK